MKTWLFALALVVGCGGEGADPSECVDGTDNDYDSLMDCRDPGCASALACADPAQDTAGPRTDGLAAQLPTPPAQ